MPWRVSPRFVLATALFFLSGALGLGYELVWIQKASLIVGASQIALATVLTSFFMGLAVGSWAVGKYLRSRRWSPLLVYGLFEIAIGIFALLFPVLFEGIEALYGALYPAFSIHGGALLLLRFLLVFVLFLPPTFCMGGTLPLLLDGLVARDRAVGPLTSFLYGINILGAVCGVLVTSYMAIPHMGMNGTSLAAGVCNLAVGAVAVCSFWRLRPVHAVTGSDAAAPVAPSFVVLSFISGLAAIGYQVHWARYFHLFMPGNVHVTANLLATYLLALALGSLALVPLLRKGIRPLRLLAILQPLVPIVAFTTIRWWRFAPYQIDVLDHYEVAARWAFWSETVDAVFVAPALQVALVIFVPVMLLGTGLPAIIAAATKGAGTLRASAGRLVFWNLVGSSAGGVVAGYVLLPGLGLNLGFAALAVASVGLGAGAEWMLRKDGRRAYGSPGYALAGLAIAFILGWGRGDLTAATLERDRSQTVFLEDRLIAIREGPVTTAYVRDGPVSRSLGSGSVRMAVAYRDRVSAQRLQGYLAPLFVAREGPLESALGIAIGTGQTFGALLQAPVQRMDVVDISPEIVSLALEHFGSFNNELGRDERVTIHLDDGRHFVDRAPDRSYDVVSLEPPPPTGEGVYRLYSLEFYQGVSRILRDHGVLAQWLPLYLVTPDDARGMIKTQAHVFPQTFVVQMAARDFLIVSVKSNPPPIFRRSWIEQRLAGLRAEPTLGEEQWGGQGEYRAASFESVLSFLIAGPDDVARMEAPCLHRDDDQRLAYSSGDRWLMRRYGDHGLAGLSFAALPVTPFRDLQQYFADPIPVAALEEARAGNLAELGFASPLRVAAEEAAFDLAEDPALRAQHAVALADLFAASHRVPESLFWFGKAVAAAPTDADSERTAAARLFVRDHVVVYSTGIRDWIATLSGAHRASPLAQAMIDELAAHDRREASRRARYLFEPARGRSGRVK